MIKRNMSHFDVESIRETLLYAEEISHDELTTAVSGLCNEVMALYHLIEALSEALNLHMRGKECTL